MKNMQFRASLTFKEVSMRIMGVLLGVVLLMATAACHSTQVKIPTAPIGANGITTTCPPRLSLPAWGAWGCWCSDLFQSIKTNDLRKPTTKPYKRRAPLD